MSVRVLLVAVVVVLLACLLFAADRTLKVIKHARRRRESARRLTAATAQAEAKNRQRKATERASGALTSIMPTIHDVDTRHVD
jgi:AmiR/NasT family two-component response regulator